MPSSASSPPPAPPPRNSWSSNANTNMKFYELFDGKFKKVMIMKKFILTFLAAATMLGAQAQNQFSRVEFVEYTDVLPRMFTIVTYMYSQDYNTHGQYYYDTVRIINSDLQVEKTFTLNLEEYGYMLPAQIRFFDFDADYINPERDFYYTQTLFNNDSKFEYIRPVYQGGIAVGFTVKRYEIVADDGTVTGTITWDEGYYASEDPHIYLYKFGDKYYINFDLSNDNDTITVWYKLGPQTQQSITRVENVPFSVRPTVAQRGSDITVQLEEGSNAREIVVIDALGREMKRIPVVQGHREVRISTSDLSAGIGFVSDRRNGSVKIMIR